MTKPSNKLLNRISSWIALIVILISANGCQSVSTKPKISDYCLFYHRQKCDPNNVACLGDELNYICLCEKDSNLAKEICSPG